MPPPSPRSPDDPRPYYDAAQRQRADLDRLSRRRFLRGLAAAGTLGAAGLAGLPLLRAADSPLPAPLAPAVRPAYTGPNLVLVRFGGGVRRQETLVPERTWCPWFLKELAPRGVLFPRMDISQFGGTPQQKLDTSHGQGTLYLLTGAYEKYADVDGQFLGARFESKAPTLFEYLRAACDVPRHQTLLINGEDRTDEEFYTFSNHHLFGFNTRGEALSLYRFKVWKLRRALAEDPLDEAQRAAAQAELAKMESIANRGSTASTGGLDYAPEVDAFWERWRALYGADGYRNPRGDRLLTELAVQAMTHLQPRLLMVNYNDPDYVHWGNPNHYTQGISIIDRGIRRLIETTQALDAYRDNTVFVIVPDCGRDNNPLVRVPFQHHFNSRSSHEIFCLVVGPGVPRGIVVDKPVDQIQVAATVGALMGFPTPNTEGDVLEAAFA